ncbi:MAG: MFS transporter [Myxococcota bacterium]|nr:MFS transporter [Myxococcota bacterium]
MGDAAVYPARKIFVLSSVALFTAGLSFALRAAVISSIEAEILAPIDPEGYSAMSGQLLGVAFLGFGITLGFGSAFLDKIGMGRALIACGICFAVGTTLSVLAEVLASGDGVYRVLLVGFLVSGLGWGLMEAAVNPLTAALYPDDKTNRLNLVHAWWPAGIIAGGLIGVGIEALGVAWEIQLAVVIVPALACVSLCIGTPFPRTERAAMGVSMTEMFAEIFRQPMFLVWLACMFLTAAAELAPGQWIDLTLTRAVGMRGIWLLVYVSGMMFVLRHFAGPIAHRVSNVVMLWGSAVLTTCGLLLLPVADSPWTGLGAATIWGLGVCFLWPTMLANVSERFPRGGEFFVGLMGVAGALAMHFVLPVLGAVFDDTRNALAGSEVGFAVLDPAAQDAILRSASQVSFQTLAWLPAVLIVVFGAIAVYERVAVRSRA